MSAERDSFNEARLERLVDEATAVTPDMIAELHALFPEDDESINRICSAIALRFVNEAWPTLSSDDPEVHTDAVKAATDVQKNFLTEMLVLGTIDNGHSVGVKQFHLWRDAALGLRGEA